MGEAVFYDTWAWVALANRRDPEHERALDVEKSLHRRGVRALTTDYVVDETLTLIRARAGADTALAWGDAFFGLTTLGRITLEPIDPGRLQAAWRLFRRYRDLDRHSFTDCSSFAVMHELSTLEVFSADRHFEQAGMGFHCLC